ncbi:hypothetical protein OIU35_31675 [Boseaceae bacterium BT-24-1]|nr:hypothetical protein [Boseaceae bacterium BT-24-1]
MVTKMDDAGMVTTQIPGFQGWVDDLNDRIEAIGDTDIPLEWTPEHVGARLIEAYETLRESGGRVGPKAFGNGWPEMMREFADLVDPDAQKNHAAERSSSRNRPSSEAISRMTEALAWPRRFLDGELMLADSLMLWTYARAHELDMERLLHSRKKRAMVMLAEMEHRANRLPRAGDTRLLSEQWRAAARAMLCADILATANAALAAAPPAEHHQIQAKARARLLAGCKALKCFPTKYRLRDALPNRVMARTTLDRLRKQAMQIVATKLRRAGVAVR